MGVKRRSPAPPAAWTLTPVETLSDAELEALRAVLQRAHDEVGGEIVRRAAERGR